MKTFITLITIITVSCSMAYAEQKRLVPLGGKPTGYYVEGSSSHSIANDVNNNNAAIIMKGYIASVESINNGERFDPTKKCIILSKMKEVSKEDLQFKEYKRYVEQVLTKKGFSVTDNPDDAAIEVFLNYSVLYNPGAANLFVRQICLDAYEKASENNCFVRQVGSDADTYTLHRELKEKKHLWRTDITSNGFSSDLRNIIPVLIYMAMPYIGENTKGRKDLELMGNKAKIDQIIFSIYDELPTKP